MYDVAVSKTFQKQFHSLQKEIQVRIKIALENLQTYPIKTRSGADIKPLRNTKPRKYRLRVGEFRIIYFIEKEKVYIIEVFKRGRGY